MVNCIWEAQSKAYKRLNTWTRITIINNEWKHNLEHVENLFRRKQIWTLIKYYPLRIRTNMGMQRLQLLRRCLTRGKYTQTELN
jgi:hypothetical protein